MTFNIRLDGLESDLNNHFTLRVLRLGSFFNSTKPWLVGLQEPFSGQLLHLQRETTRDYSVLGFERNLDRSHPIRMNDYQTAIMYDKTRLDLVDHDHFWLSKTPREPSKDWNSVGTRTVTIGAFHRKDSADAHSVDFVHLNTHLDVWSERARREQARIVHKTAVEWQKKYPNAIVIITGDFNAANGHAPHRILLADEIVHGAWDLCAADDACVSQDFGSSFHGWLGTIVNRYAARLLQYLLQTMHGSGVELPSHVRMVTWEETKNIVSQLSLEKLWHGMPTSWSRIHVDWILVSANVEVKMVFVAEVRDVDFSSDHFPILALLKPKE
jgi:endonuclease/exonuclease/phosphatase family metal-dependent hydrolase